MPRDHEAPSAYDSNDTDKHDVPQSSVESGNAVEDSLVDRSTFDEHTPMDTPEKPIDKAWSAERVRPIPEHEVNGEVLTDEEIVGALGQKFAGTLSAGVLNKLKTSPSMREARDVLRGMSSKNLGVAYDADEKLAEMLQGVFDKHFSGDSESSAEFGTAPDGLPSTEEAQLQSRGKLGIRGFAKEAWGIGKDMGTLAAGNRLTSYAWAKLLPKYYERQERQREKYSKMTDAEKKRARLGFAFAAMGTVATYMVARHYMVEWGSGGNTQNAIAFPGNEHHGNGPHGNPPLPGQEGQPGANGGTPDPNDHHGGHNPVELPTKGGEFTYDQNLDPARDIHKHGNDWGTAVIGTPEDNGKPAGYAQFFDQRIKQSPKEFSATLSEFGLNGKSSTDINSLADQMQADPKLAQEKYNLLMDKIGKAKVSEIYYDGDYGSYYAVSNPDGSVTLSYDEVVAGKHGNRFIVFEIDGVKHYGHPDCGMQWSHFNPNAPQPVVEQHTQVQTYRSGTNHINNHPPINQPPPRSLPPPPVDTPPPQGPPEQPPEQPPPPPPPPEQPPGGKGNEYPDHSSLTNDLGPGERMPTPAPVETTVDTNTGRNVGGNGLDSVLRDIVTNRPGSNTGGIDTSPGVTQGRGLNTSGNSGAGGGVEAGGAPSGTSQGDPGSR